MDEWETFYTKTLGQSKCETTLTKILAQPNGCTSKFLHLIQEAKQSQNPLSVKCEPCNIKYNSFYEPDSSKVVICSNQLQTTKQVEHALNHELTHVYDHVVQKQDLHSCDLLACSEIRASVFGECKDENNKELCVRTNAILSTKLSCPNAEQNVDRVFFKCFHDQRPFQ